MNKKTEKELNEAIAADPDNAELYYELALVIYEEKYETGKPIHAHRASDELLKAIRLDPFNGKYHFLRVEYSAHTSSQHWEEELNRCILLKYKVKECKAILKTYEQVWGMGDDQDYIDKQFENVKKDPSAENYYFLGRCLRSAGDEDSLKYFNKALEIDANHAASMASIAFYHQDRGMLREALKWFLNSIEHAPNDEIKATYYSWTGSLYEQMGDYQNTLDIRLKSRNELGGDYQRLAKIGDSYLKLERYEEAEKTLLEVIKDDIVGGNYHGTYCNLVVLYAQLQKF